MAETGSIKARELIMKIHRADVRIRAIRWCSAPFCVDLVVVVPSTSERGQEGLHNCSSMDTSHNAVSWERAYIIDINAVISYN
jgi:hypothetical protein